MPRSAPSKPLSPYLHPSAITPSTIRAAIRAYPAHVPSALHSLDEARYTTIPAAARARTQKPDDSPPYLEKQELATLVEWKLKHGTFRPKLLALVGENSAGAVQASTRDAFALLGRDAAGDGEGAAVDPASARTALDRLTSLRGVGPATASLVLSAYAPARVPFFSDELFRWVVGRGNWGVGIKYTAKEWGELVSGVGEVLRRLRRDGEREQGKGGMIGAVELEKCAWVLGRGWSGDGGDGDGDEKSREGIGEDAERSEEKKVEKRSLKHDEDEAEETTDKSVLKKRKKSTPRRR